MAETGASTSRQRAGAPCPLRGQGGGHAAGDGFFATFDGPVRALRCAKSIVGSVESLGIEVRAGLHMGECEVIDNKVGGLAVNIGSRICGLARPSEVLASQTIKDLVAGTGLWFEDRGAHELKGVPGEWRLFTLENGESGAPATARSPRAADSSMRGDS